MTKLISVTLVTVSLWILQKSETDCVQLPSPNDKALKSQRYEYGHQTGVSEILNDLLLANKHESLSEKSFENGESRSFLIKKFCTLFTNAILSSDRLSAMYDTSLPTDQAAETYHRVFLNALTNVHAYDTRTVSLNISTAVKDTFGQLTQTQHVQAYGYSAAKFMTSMNVLTPKNLKQLCDSYVGFNQKQAKHVPHIPDRRSAYIQAILNSLVHFMTSLNIYNGKHAEQLSKYLVMFLYKLTKVSYIPMKDPCSADSVVDIFATEFTKSVLKSPKLSEVYDTSMPPKEAEEAYFRVALNAVFNVHTYDPSGVSRICSDAIRDTFGSLNVTQHVLSHGYAAGEYLQSMKTLTCESLQQLDDYFLAYVEEAVRNVPSIPDRRVAFVQAVADGFDHFMASLNLFTADGVVLMCQNFASSLYFLTGTPNTHHYDPPTCSRDSGDIFFEQN